MIVPPIVLIAQTPALRDPNGRLLFIGNAVTHVDRSATVVTHDDSRVTVRYVDGTYAHVDPLSLVRIGR